VLHLLVRKEILQTNTKAVPFFRHAAIDGFQNEGDLIGPRVHFIFFPCLRAAASRPKASLCCIKPYIYCAILAIKLIRMAGFEQVPIAIFTDGELRTATDRDY